jgi:hypothetical protein
MATFVDTPPSLAKNLVSCNQYAAHKSHMLINTVAGSAAMTLSKYSLCASIQSTNTALQYCFDGEVPAYCLQTWRMAWGDEICLMM